MEQKNKDVQATSQEIAYVSDIYTLPRAKWNGVRETTAFQPGNPYGELLLVSLDQKILVPIPAFKEEGGPDDILIGEVLATGEGITGSGQRKLVVLAEGQYQATLLKRGDTEHWMEFLVVSSSR